MPDNTPKLKVRLKTFNNTVYQPESKQEVDSNDKTPQEEHPDIFFEDPNIG